MVITNDIKVKCNKAAKDVTHKHGTLEQIAQVNSLHGIFTAFKSQNAANKAEIPIAKFIKKTHDKAESLEMVYMNFKEDLGGEPDFVSMGTGDKTVTIFAGKDGKISKREINELDGKSKEAFDIKEYIPSFKGKACKPTEISKTDFYNEKDNTLINRSHITYECDGIKTIVDWRNKRTEGSPDVREILNYPGIKDVLTCVNKGGILELNVKTNTLTLRTSSNGEQIDYGMKNYGFKKLTELICDHPGEGHALIRGESSKGKDTFMMINLSVRDPLGLVFHKFDAPFKGSKEIHSSRYMDYFLLTFSEKKDGKKHYLLLNPGDKEIRVTAKSKPYEIVFKAKGHDEAKKKEFQLKMKIEGTKLVETKVIQFPGQYTDFNKKERYDLDNYLKFTGPVKSVKIVIPDGIKSKVTDLMNKKTERIEVLKDDKDHPDITIVVPSAQLTQLVQAEGIYLLFRSNEFETEIKEIYQGVNDQSVFYVQEPCDSISFDSKSGYGTINLSCPKSVDILIHTEKKGTGRVHAKNVRYSSPSTKSSITHISEGHAVVAKTVKSSDSEVTIKIDKVNVAKPAEAGKARRYIQSDASASIKACKFPYF
jgi:hypothetical protein